MPTAPYWQPKLGKCDLADAKHWRRKEFAPSKSKTDAKLISNIDNTPSNSKDKIPFPLELFPFLPGTEEEQCVIFSFGRCKV